MLRPPLSYGDPRGHHRGMVMENIRVLEASPRNVFDREARRAAARWRFAPRTENGAPVSREAVKTLHFRLQGER